MNKLSNQEMIRAYNGLEREMHELRNNIGRRIESSDTEAIKVWQTRARDAKEKMSEDIKKSALQLAGAAERIREITNMGARVIEIAPICDVRADR